MAKNIPMPSSADPAGPPDCFASELSRPDSASSAITLDVSKDAWLHCDHATQGKSTEWTNEKHSMYLDYLEASFVEDLYGSMYSGGLGKKKNPRRPYSSDQFVVHGDGGREKIGYERNELLFDSTADSHVMIKSSFSHHLEYSGTGCSVTCLNSQEHVLREHEIHSKGKLAGLYESASSEQNAVGHKCHQDLVWSAAEFSDQNFVEDNPGGKLSRKYLSKRLKTAANDGSSNDQVINISHEDNSGISLPDKFRARGVSIGNNMSCTRKGRNALLSAWQVRIGIDTPQKK